MIRQSSNFRTFGNLSGILEKRLNQLGIKKQVDAAMICEEFDKAVYEVFGGLGQKNVRAISYKDNCLKIGVTSSAWANEINLRQLELKNDQNVRVVYKTGKGF